MRHVKPTCTVAQDHYLLFNHCCTWHLAICMSSILGQQPACGFVSYQARQLNINNAMHACIHACIIPWAGAYYCCCWLCSAGRLLLLGCLIAWRRAVWKKRTLPLEPGCGSGSGGPTACVATRLSSLRRMPTGNLSATSPPYNTPTPSHKHSLCPVQRWPA